MMATIMTTVEEYLGLRWIVLAALGQAAIEKVHLSLTLVGAFIPSLLISPETVWMNY